VVAIRRCEAQPDAGIDELGMRVVTTMEFRDGFGIDVPRLRLDERAFLKMRLEQSLCANEERRSIVAVPIRVAPGHNFGTEDQDLGLRVLWERGINGIEENVALMLLAGFEKAVELKL
jgi:hypothetical protein